MNMNQTATGQETAVYGQEWEMQVQRTDRGKLHVVPSTSSPTREQELRLEEIDARLQELHVAANLVWLKKGLDNRDPVTDLRTKVESVRWMLRIAKHLKAAARQMLFSTIQSSLNQIERTIDIGAQLSDMCEVDTHAHATRHA